jgi:hypothetical protein
MASDTTTHRFGTKVAIACAAAWLSVAAAIPARADAVKPEANKTVHFPQGAWAAAPQTGPDGKVRQCVLAAFRNRTTDHGPLETSFSLIIGRGAGLAVTVTDDKLPSEQILDDQAEILIDNKSFPADAFSLGPGASAKSLVIHPGDAAGVLGALGSAKQVTLRSAGAGIDTGSIALQLPGDALDYLKSCGRTFDIALDHPTDPDAPVMPVPRPRSPRIVPVVQQAAASPGITDIQKVDGWDASELRADDGTIDMCYIRRRYSSGKGADLQMTVLAVLVGRAGGLRLLLEDTNLKMARDQQLDATLTADGKPVDGIVVAPMSTNEIGIFPRHGKAFAALLDQSNDLDFKSKAVGMEFSIGGSIMGWARACARRNGFEIEPGQRS